MTERDATARTSGVPPEVEREIEAVADGAGLEIYHLEFKGGLLRIFIDREDGGVDLTDCEFISKQVSALLDVVDFGRGRYTLEVSSPGLDRQLYRPRDYQRFSGQLARVTYRDPASRAKRTVVGRLGELQQPSAGEPVVILDLAESDAPLEIPLGAVEVARLEIEL